MVKSLSILNYTLNQRYNKICYHRVSKAQAADIIQVDWIEGIRNLAGLFTKIKISITTRKGIISKICNNSLAVVTLNEG